MNRPEAKIRFGGDPKCVVQRVVMKSIGKKNKGAVLIMMENKQNMKRLLIWPRKIK